MTADGATFPFTMASAKVGFTIPKPVDPTQQGRWGQGAAKL